MAKARQSTHCGRMDHGGCLLQVDVEGGKITGIQGDPDGHLNRGYCCPKGRAMAEVHAHPDRLTTPLIRTGKRGANAWRPASWEEALDTIAHNLDRIRSRDGARSVAFCQGMPKGMEHFALIRLANTFGSPNLVAVQDVCHAPRELTGRHVCGFYPVPDLTRSTGLILLWGSNPRATNEEGSINSQLAARLQEGTQLVVVDPRKTELAKRAAHWLPLRPGTDTAMALGFLHVILTEELWDRDFVDNWTHGFPELRDHVAGVSLDWVAGVTGVDAEAIREAARAYGRAAPACLAWGNAVEQSPSTMHTVRALVSLMAVCGNLDVPGGNIKAKEPKVLPPGKFVRADLLPDKRSTSLNASYKTSPKLMTVPSTFFRRAVIDEQPYPVRAAYMQCTNPMLSHPDPDLTREALTKLEFLAVSDVFMTPTAALADVVLPAASQFEFDDIGHYGLGHGMILARPKLVDPPGQCRPDMAIINELGNRLCPEGLWFTRSEQMLENLLAPSGLSWEEFVDQKILRGQDRFYFYENKGFSTPTGKVELVLSTAADLGTTPLPEYVEPEVQPSEAFPLLLTTAKSPNFLMSSYRWVESLMRREPAPKVQIHPDTAAASGLSDGENACIETLAGRIVQQVDVSDEIQPGVVSAVPGVWFPDLGGHREASWQRANVNRLLTVEYLGRQFGTPRLRGVPCRIGPDREGPVRE